MKTKSHRKAKKPLFKASVGVKVVHLELEESVFPLVKTHLGYTCTNLC